MARLVIKEAKLSDAGKARLDEISRKLSMSLQAMLEENVPRIKDAVIEFAPTAEEEKNLISWPGSPWDFFQDIHNTLRNAIEGENFVVKEMNDVVSIELGDPKKINPILKFSWYHGSKKDGTSELRSSTDSNAGDAWSHMLEMWEYGGTDPFVVTARDGGMLTQFGPNEDTRGLSRKVAAVGKHIPWIPRGQPFSMYKFAGQQYRETLLRQAREAVKRIQL